MSLTLLFSPPIFLYAQQVSPLSPVDSLQARATAREIQDSVFAGKRNLILGDSNGAFEYGWASQLENLRSNDSFCNTSRSGNTIGFYNNGRSDLNTLVMLGQYLERAENEMQGIDRVLIMLGTNDCKAVFADSARQSVKNLDRLIRILKKDPRTKRAGIFIISPPPIAADSLLLEKYYGAAARMERLLPRQQKIAKKRGCTWIDTWPSLEEKWRELSTDGIHLTPEGQKILAFQINIALNREQ